MPFYYRNDDVKFDVEDLPLEAWIRIQEATGMEWHECLGRNLIGNSKVAKAVLAECADATGTILPEKMTVRTVLSLMVFEKGENIPAQYDEGFPVPKAEGSEPGTI